MCAVILGEARHDCFSQNNAGEDVVGLQVAPPYYRGMQLKVCQTQSRDRRGTMCQFESKEVCEPLCFHSKSECTGCRKLVV